MAKSVVIDHYEPKAVMRGLLDGDDFSNRVAGTCIYMCPRCAHRIRFAGEASTARMDAP